MKNQTRIGNISGSMIPLLLLSTILVACSPGFSDHIRKHTYPPKFNYITSKQIKSTMWRLAQHVSNLDRIMSKTDKPGETQRLEAIQILSEMEMLSMSLEGKGWSSNHPVVSKHISGFRRELVAARRALSAQPPGFYLARTISEACAHCHETR